MNTTRVNIRNAVFGRLTVIEEAPPQGRRGVTAWWCLCECGKRVISRTQALRSGRKRSCGCLSRALASARYREGWDHRAAAKKVPKSVRLSRAKAGAAARAT